MYLSKDFIFTNCLLAYHRFRIHVTWALYQPPKVNGQSTHGFAIYVTVSKCRGKDFSGQTDFSLLCLVLDNSWKVLNIVLTFFYSQIIFSMNTYKISTLKKQVIKVCAEIVVIQMDVKVCLGFFIFKLFSKTLNIFCYYYFKKILYIRIVIRY